MVNLPLFSLLLSPQLKVARKRKHNLVDFLFIFEYNEGNNVRLVSTHEFCAKTSKKKKRSWYSYQPLNVKDYLVILLALLGVAIVVLLFFVNQGRFFNPFH